MRSIKWLGFILTAVFLLFCGCGGGPSGCYHPSAALGTQLHYRHGGLHQGDADHAEQPHQQRRSGDLVQCEPGPSGGPEPEHQHGHHQWNPNGRDRHGQLHGNGFQLGRQHHASLNITVNDAAPAGLAYTTGTAVYTVGTPITPNSPTSSGGAVTAYSVSPDLPAGLSLDDDTGIISGTPTAVTAKASYTVTASNLTGSTTATLTITVNAAAAGVQFIPNMNQWITPLAPQGSQFQSSGHPLASKR